MNPLHEFVNTVSPISLSSFEKIKPFLIEINIKAGEVLCKIGEVVKYGYLIQDGLITSAIPVNTDKIFIRGIYKSDDFIGPHPALMVDIPSSFEYKAITDCTLIQFEYEKIRELYYENPDLLRFGYKTLELFYINLEETVVSLGTRDAKDRYLEFRETYATVEKLIPLNQVASYLGITSIQLSRIRKVLKSENLLN